MKIFPICKINGNDDFKLQCGNYIEVNGMKRKISEKLLPVISNN